MKRYFLIFFLFVSTISSAQVIFYGKPLPIHAYRIGTTVAYNTDTYVSDGGVAAYISGGYGINYSTEINIKYAYYKNADYFGLDVQHLFKESRKSYFNIIGGLHWQDDFWFDLSGTFTYTPQFNINLTVGLDFELGFTDPLELRVWIPLNAGIELGRYTYMYFEFDLPANEFSWPIVSLGASYILR